MENAIYSKTVLPARDSLDGEYPTTWCATEEINGYGVFRSSHEGGTELYAWVHGTTEERRAEAIEIAVDQAREELETFRRIEQERVEHAEERKTATLAKLREIRLELAKSRPAV